MPRKIDTHHAKLHSKITECAHQFDFSIDSNYVLYVDVNQGSNGDGSRHSPYSTIQAAVSAVSSAGDNADDVGYIIFVAPGTYTETLTLESTSLYNLSFIAMGGPHGVIMDPASGDALESTASNDNLHYLYFKGFRFKGNIDFDGADNKKFLYNDGTFEDCTFDEDNDSITINVNCAGRFYWKNGKIHVMSNLTFENVYSCGIYGEHYRDMFPIAGAPGTITLNADTTGNVPYDMKDANGGGDQAAFHIENAFVQRKMPDITNTGTGKQLVYIRWGYLGLGVQTLTIPSDSEFSGYGAVLNKNLTISSGATGWLYNTCVINTYTETGTTHNYANET